MATETENSKMYYAVARTYTEDGEYMNSEWNYVMVPQSVYEKSDDEIAAYIKAEISDEMDCRCDPDDGEAYWQLDDWGEETSGNE